jgi:diguanylate cyclase (GGDEF)-like protein
MIGYGRQQSLGVALAVVATQRWPVGWIVALLSVMGGALIGFWPGSPYRSVPLIVPGLLAAISLFGAWRRHPSHPLRLAWFCGAVGISFSTLSPMLDTLILVAGLPLGDPSAICNMLAYPCYLLAGGVRIRQVAGRGLSVTALLDALTTTLVAGALGAHIFMSLAATDSLTRVLDVSIPALASLSILLQTLYLVYQSPRGQQQAPLLLTCVAVLATGANWLVALQAIAAISISNSIPIFLIMLLMLLLAALPVVDEIVFADTPPESVERPHATLLLALPYLSLALLTVHVISMRLTDAGDQFWLERVLAVCVLLVLARQWLMLRVNSQLLDALQASHAAVALARDEAAREARTDALTGLPNQRLLREYLTTTLAYHRRTGLPLALLFVDIDHFKLVNDRYGHPTGDLVLVEIGRRLRHGMREGDIVARYGGEEFVVLLPNTGSDEGLLVAERVCQGVRAAEVNLPDGETVAITLSGGIATYPAHGDSADALLRAADEALYAAKRAGRARIICAQAAPRPGGMPRR